MANRRNTNTPTKRQRETIIDKMSTITRRQFIIGAAATGAVIAASGGIYYAVEGSKTEEGVEKLEVAYSQIVGIDDCEKDDSLDNYVYLEREVDLEYNTIVHVSSDSYAAVLEPTDTGSPLVTASIISLVNSDKTTILKNAVTQERNFEVFDFRADESGFVWTESNVLTGKIYVYTAPFNSDVSASAKVALALDASSQLPEIEIFDNTAWIQVTPKTDTSATTTASATEKSKLYKITIGQDSSQIQQVLETKSFATAPVHAKSGIVVSPKNEVSTSRYDIRLLDGQTGTLKDILTLPQSMTPQDVAYGKTGFSFSFQGSYDYGDGISGVGTYAQMQLGSVLSDDSLASKDARLKNESGVNWLNFARSPFSAPAWVASMIAFKSTKSVAIFKPDEKKYALISADEGADDYGVWLVSTGEVEKLATITNIDYTPLSGSAIKACKLRVYAV